MDRPRYLLPHMSAKHGVGQGPPEKRKRAPKASVACDTCRRLKSKCDQNMPCRTCVANSEECVYRSKQPTKYKNNTRFMQSSTREPSSGNLELTDLAHVTDQPSVNQASISSRAPAPAVDNESGNRYVQHWNSDNILDGNLAASPPLNTTVIATSGSIPAADDQLADDTSSEEETFPQGFGETNSRTNGREFYGPAATLAFLLELRSRAATFRRKTRANKPRNQSHLAQSRSSLVNMMDGGEGNGSDQDGMALEGSAVIESPESQRPFPSPNFQSLAPFTLSNQAVEKACIENYFSNLHHIYYFLIKANFVSRCTNEIWTGTNSDSGDQTIQRRRGSKFPAVYCAVVALGALTAGEPLVGDTEEDGAAPFWDQLTKHCSEGASTPIKQSKLPRELAKIYFSRAKALLGDFFEACSLESQQALFLMSIFCMYALKPHSSYMYHGMALRTAMAIGASNLPDTTKNPVAAIRTWWLMYSHEMELCSLLGRETCLRDAEHYPVFLAKFGDAIPPQMGSERDENLFFARCNTELARIMKQISEQIYQTGSVANNNVQQTNRHQAALDLDERLAQWKANLNPTFDLDVAPLTEREIVTKRKTIFQLRLNFARIMIHRPFLVLAANQSPRTNAFDVNVRTCLTTARQTIQHLYDTFKYRPFFRTWWYATSYAFNASSIILYTLVTGLHGEKATVLLSDVEKALKIFQAMDGITVAQRCADLTREMLEVAELAARAETNGHSATLSAQGQLGPGEYAQGTNIYTAIPSVQQPTEMSQLPAPPDLFGPLSNGGMSVGSDGTNFPADDDFFRNMMDANLLDSFGANVMGGMEFDLNNMDGYYNAGPLYGDHRDLIW